MSTEGNQHPRRHDLLRTLARQGAHFGSLTEINEILGKPNIWLNYKKGYSDTPRVVKMNKYREELALRKNNNTKFYIVKRKRGAEMKMKRPNKDLENIKKGLRLELCGEDRLGLLSDVTKIFIENGLSVTREEVTTRGSEAVDAFYVIDSSGTEVKSKTIEAFINTIGETILKVKEDETYRVYLLSIGLGLASQQGTSSVSFSHMYYTSRRSKDDSMVEYGYED
nr:hypothetical protein [Tanacetum cinerariifolium]